MVPTETDPWMSTGDEFCGTARMPPVPTVNEPPVTRDAVGSTRAAAPAPTRKPVSTVTAPVISRIAPGETDTDR